MIQDIWRFHIELWEIVIGIFYFIFWHINSINYIKENILIYNKNILCFFHENDQFLKIDGPLDKFLLCFDWQVDGTGVRSEDHRQGSLLWEGNTGLQVYSCFIPTVMTYR